MYKVVTAAVAIAALAGAGCTTTEQGAGLGGLYGASTGAAIGGATGAMVGAATAAPAAYPAGVYAAPAPVVVGAPVVAVAPVVVAAPIVVGGRSRVVRRTVVYR